jgi:hypothetical protein
MIMDEKCYSVITSDVVDSRNIASFPQKRDRRLRHVTDLHMEQKLILSPYAITAWDEFQVVVKRPEFTPRILLDLRRLFYPFQLRIAIGIGRASGVHKRPTNVHAGGEAFELARVASDRLKSGNAKYRTLTNFESRKDVFNTIANTIYRLHDSLLEQTTKKQWAAINVQMNTGRQDLTARRMRVDISTVSRNLRRAYYWHFIETATAMESIIKAYF